MSGWNTTHKLIVNILDEDAPEYFDYIHPGNVNISSGTGTTPLHLACLSSCCSLASHLLSVGAKINVGNEYGETPLHWACKNGNLKTVILLVNHGAMLRVGDSEGNSPLHWLAENDHSSIAQYLLEEDPRLAFISNDEGHTALHTACEWESYELMELLIEHELQYECPSRIQNTLFREAIMADNPKLIHISLRYAQLDEESLDTWKTLAKSNEAHECVETLTKQVCKKKLHQSREERKGSKRNLLGITKHALVKLGITFQ